MQKLQDILENYYRIYDEEGRLLSRHGQVEYLTTMEYIHRYAKTGASILEIGAATGRYSIALAQEGYKVTAVELLDCNLQQLRAKPDSKKLENILHGNAVDLSFLKENHFDITLLLGPMYHLFSEEEQVKALQEAIRVTKPDGYIFVAYVMNDHVIIYYLFGKNEIANHPNVHIDENWKIINDNVEEKIAVMRIEDIDELNEKVGATRIKLLSSDGLTKYIRDAIDEMDEETFRLYMNYHMATCERIDVIGQSAHALDILQKPMWKQTKRIG